MAAIKAQTSVMIQQARAAVADRPMAAIPSFLVKLATILENADQSIIHWLPHGRSFVVTDVDQFSNKVLSTYFKSNNFASFVRQLNFYGFHKIAGETKKTWEFKHNAFRRDIPALVYEIKRKTSAEYVVPEQSDVVELRGEVATLRAQVLTLNATVGHLTKILASLAPQAVAAAGLDVPADAVRAEPAKAVQRKRKASSAASKRRRADASMVEEGNGAVPAPVVKSEPQVEAKPRVGVAGPSAEAQALAATGELPQALIDSFDSLDFSGAATTTVPSVDISAFVDSVDMSAGMDAPDMAAPPVLAEPVGAGTPRALARSNSGDIGAPPALTRSLSSNSINNFFSGTADSMPADLPTAAAFGAASTVLSQLPAAALLTGLVAANAASNSRGAQLPPFYRSSGTALMSDE